MQRIELLVRPSAENALVKELVPVIDGLDLIARVSSFEAEQGFDVASGYDGIVPSHFRFGPLAEYFLGQGEDQYPDPGRIVAIACSCGEIGCWPLYCTVSISPTTVRWDEFEQPHRPTRDYTGFGPFEFDRAAYETAVRDAVLALGG